MILKSIRLTDFKNHTDSVFDFNDRVNCIIGNNGKGKTNLLDAIYYLSFSKSALGTLDKLAIQHEKSSFTLFGIYDELKIALQVEKGKSKLLKLDGKTPEKISDLIGKVPLVMVLPDDTAMIKEGSEERRRFFDSAICQFDKAYLHNLMAYNKILKQRNSLLKEWAKGKPIDLTLVDVYDDQLVPLAISISEKREKLLSVFLPYLIENYADLHATKETPSLTFKTHVTADFALDFKNGLQRDQLMQRTLLGSHRDDYIFELDGELIKKFGSQGQQKTYLIALKLALFDFLKSQTGKKPLLLLDDIFDKLDESRITLLVDLLKNQDRFGQIFLSDARSERSKTQFQKEENVKFFELT